MKLYPSSPSLSVLSSFSLSSPSPSLSNSKITYNNMGIGFHCRIGFLGQDLLLVFFLPGL